MMADKIASETPEAIRPLRARRFYPNHEALRPGIAGHPAMR